MFKVLLLHDALLFFRLYSIQVITEHDRLVKVVVPCPWVDDFLGVVSWPPKGKKTVGQYIASWAAPKKKLDNIRNCLNTSRVRNKGRGGSSA